MSRCGGGLFSCGSVSAIDPGLWLEFQKLGLIALRQFEIPGAKAPGQSFAETAPMQSNKPPPPRLMASALEICGNTCFLPEGPLNLNTDLALIGLERCFTE